MKRKAWLDVWVTSTGHYRAELFTGTRQRVVLLTPRLKKIAQASPCLTPASVQRMAAIAREMIERGETKRLVDIVPLLLDQIDGAP